jgi:predicted dehydrogenase
MAGSKPIKTGIIGMGGIGPAHYDAICRVGGVQVTSIAEVDRKRAAFCGEKYAIPKVYSDYRALLGDSEVDVVHITSPNYLHYAQAKDALEAGKHVVCEKPLGINPSQTAELLSLAKGKKLVNEVNYNHRFFPFVFQAREMIRRNELGPITLIRAYTLGDLMLSLSLDDPDHWRTNPETVGLSKTMSTYGGHCLDLLQFVSGLKIRQIFADFGYVDPTKKGITYDGHDFIREEGGQLEDHANLLLRFDDGIRGAVTFSEAAPGRKCEVFFEIIGTKASIAWNLANPNQMWIGHQNQPNKLFYKDAGLFYPASKAIAGPPDWQQDGFVDSLKHCFISVYDYIREKKHLKDIDPDFATFETGHNMELILQGIMNSVKYERWEKIECS